jgi:hypothetical protein
MYCYLGKVFCGLALAHMEWSLLSVSGQIQVLGFDAARTAFAGTPVLESCLPLRTESLADGLLVLNIITHVDDIAH